VTSNQLVTTLLEHRQATVFAPNNEAMANFQGEKGQDLLLYHIGMPALICSSEFRRPSLLLRFRPTHLFSGGDGAGLHPTANLTPRDSFPRARLCY